MATSTIKNVNFISKMYKANYTVQPHAFTTLTGSDFGMENIPGYLQLATLSYYTGNASEAMSVQAIGFATGSDTVVVIYNPLDTVQTGTFQIRIAFVKSNYLKYVPYGS